MNQTVEKLGDGDRWVWGAGKDISKGRVNLPSEDREEHSDKETKMCHDLQG